MSHFNDHKFNQDSVEVVKSDGSSFYVHPAVARALVKNRDAVVLSKSPYRITIISRTNPDIKLNKDNIVDNQKTVVTQKDQNVNYTPVQDQPKVFSEAEQKAYFAEFNARHRYLQNIHVDVWKTNMGETEYTITAQYRGEITPWVYFTGNTRCDLTLASYSDNLVFVDGEWKSNHIEQWLGTYHATYSEWKTVIDVATENGNAQHSENIREVEHSWQQMYHDLPLDAINAMMNTDPRLILDRVKGEIKADSSKN